jgi:hypothetical protein
LAAAVVAVLMVEMVAAEANFAIQLRHLLGYLRPVHHFRFKSVAVVALVQLVLHPLWLGAAQRVIKRIPVQGVAGGRAQQCLRVDLVDLVEQVQTVRVQQHHRL